MTENKIIKRVAVLGAGVMGAQIAAQCINVGLPVVLFDLPNKSDDAKPVNKNAIALKAIENLKKLKPAPLGLDAQANLIVAANYEDDLDLLADCDLIIEAIAERLDLKHALYEKVSPHIPTHAIFATNTSGLPIGELAKGSINSCISLRIPSSSINVSTSLPNLRSFAPISPSTFLPRRSND